MQKLDGTRFACRIRSVFSVKSEGEGKEPPRQQLPAHFLSVPFSFFLLRARYLPPPRPSLPLDLSPRTADVRSRGGCVYPSPCVLLLLCYFVPLLVCFSLFTPFDASPLFLSLVLLLKHTTVLIPLDLISALEIPSLFTVSFAKRKAEGRKWLLHLCLAALAKTIHPSP